MELPLCVFAARGADGDRWWEMGRSKRDQKRLREKKAGVKSVENGRKKNATAGNDGGAEESETEEGGKSGVAEETVEPTKKETTKKGGAKNDLENEDGEKKPKARKVLRRAVEAEVIDQSSEIARALVKGVTDGNIRTTELVISMIDKKEKDGDGSERHGGVTAADLLGSDDVWESETYEALDEKSEVGFGGREPEGEASGQCTEGVHSS